MATLPAIEDRLGGVGPKTPSEDGEYRHVLMLQCTMLTCSDNGGSILREDHILHVLFILL
jgi:hypothetical protein